MLAETTNGSSVTGFVTIPSVIFFPDHRSYLLFGETTHQRSTAVRWTWVIYHTVENKTLTTTWQTQLWLLVHHRVNEFYNESNTGVPFLFKIIANQPYLFGKQPDATSTTQTKFGRSSSFIDCFLSRKLPAEKKWLCNVHQYDINLYCHLLSSCKHN